MGENNLTGAAALVRAVRALDNGDAETLPDRLERVWDILEDRPRDSFHAAEEMLLRWLLKNMTGTSVNAERVRRYPRAWDVMGAVFTLIPLYSLAKSLADRRFVAILQQTLTDIATPQQEGTTASGTDSDVDMADAPSPESPSNPRKRKRADAATFNVSAQRQAAGCLYTAEALFEAMRTLLARCELKSLDGPATNRMGAEHVKSLFSSSATESMAVLVPWLTICGLALDTPKAEANREQSAWVSTFAALWELHLQSASDVLEVAIHLSGAATRLLGNLNRMAQQTPLGVESAVQERWARDLRRFLARNLILPARTAFLTKGSQEAVQIAVDVSAPSAHIGFPVLFDLVSKSPLELGGTTSRKDYETWIQAVFDVIIDAKKHLGRKNRHAAVRAIMEMAAERGTALSAASLRAVCKDYVQKRHCDWSLLLSIVKLNPDVFLVSEDGKELLERVLERTKEMSSFDAEDSEKAACFIVLLADGYAQARDLLSFVKVWLGYLAPTRTKDSLQPLWAQKELVDTVAKLVQTSLNTNQLVEILEWLSSQTEQTGSMARIYILEAISNGISQEESVDAASMKTFEGAFLEKFSKKELPVISACRWMVASKAIARGTLEEAGQIWSQIKSDIKGILKKSPIEREDTFAAFKCCVAAWLANYPGAADEDDAASLICSFVERLEKDGESMELDSVDSVTYVDKGTYISWILSDAPRLLSLLVERNGCVPQGVLSLLTVSGTEDSAHLNSALAASRLLLDRESSLNNQKLMDMLIATVTSMIDTSEAGRSGPQTRIAVRFLLDIPPEALSRSQREAAMKSLISHLPGDSDKAEAIGTDYWKLVLSLMVKLMGRPTFYEGMAFSHLESIGRCLLKIHKRSSRRSREGLSPSDASRDRENLRLLQQLAVLTLRQMTSGSPEEREKAYLKGAASLLQSPCQDSDAAPRIVLLQAFISTVQASPAAKKLDGNGLDLNSLKNQLLQVASSAVTSSKRTGKGLLSLLAALEALSDLDQQVVRQSLSKSVSSLVEASDSLLEDGVQAGWEVRMFVVNHFPEALASPLKIKMSVEAAEPAAGDVADEEEGHEPAATLGKTALLRYVDAVVRSADEDTKLGYLRELLLEDGDDQGALGRGLAVYRLIQHLKGSRPSDPPSRFDLAQAHTTLCTRLQRPTTASHFLLTSKAIRLLLDQNPASMTQWNIELTLSTISSLASLPTTQTLITTSPPIYHSLTQLLEQIIKRHRRRLDGHFHLLLTALQSLLRLLLSRSPTPTKTGPNHWESDARHFARLLTLVCEPTASSVSRATTTGLDSERDRAKRYAGQFMYLVVMAYVQLQVAHPAVPHGVREALEGGVYSVLDVTTEDGMRILNEGLDGGARVIFREMVKMYRRFGKWSGV